MDQGEQPQKKDRSIRRLLSANRLSSGCFEENPLSGCRIRLVLSTFPELSMKCWNGLDPDTPELREELAEVFSQCGEGLGVVTEDVIE